MNRPGRMTVVTGRHIASAPRKSLVAFLLERLAEDEAVAEAASRRRAAAQQAAADGADLHLVQQSPARALRDVAAKRAIVQMWLDGLRARLSEHRSDGLELVDAAIVELAAVYADHPDFHPGWLAGPRPDDGRGTVRRVAARSAGDAPVNVVDLRRGRPG